MTWPINFLYVVQKMFYLTRRVFDRTHRFAQPEDFVALINCYEQKPYLYNIRIAYSHVCLIFFCNIYFIRPYASAKQICKLLLPKKNPLRLTVMKEI